MVEPVTPIGFLIVNAHGFAGKEKRAGRDYTVRVNLTFYPPETEYTVHETTETIRAPIRPVRFVRAIQNG